MSGTQNPTTRQHYVPQSYLRNFTSTPSLEKNKQRIFVYDKAEKWEKELPIKKVAAEKNIYAFDWAKALDFHEYLEMERSQTLESVFRSLIEPLQQQTIDEIKSIASNSSYCSYKNTVLSDDLITSELKEKLASCIVFQYLRTKEVKDSFAEMGSKVFEHFEYLKEYFEKNTDYKISEQYLDTMNAHNRMAENEDLRGLLVTELFANEKLLTDLVQKMCGYIFCFVVNTTDYALITSDTPVIIIGHDATDKTPYFGKVGTEIIFPISPTIFLSAVDPIFFAGYKEFDRHVIKVNNDKEVTFNQNYYQLNGAKRFVFSAKTSLT